MLLLRRQVQAGNASFHEGRPQCYVLLAAKRRIRALQAGGALLYVEGGFPRMDPQEATKSHLRLGQIQPIVEPGFGRIGSLFEHGPGQV